MGTSLAYVTSRPVPAKVAAQVRHEADECAHRYDWWSDPFLFSDDPTRPGHLAGESRLTLSSYSTPSGDFVTVSADDDELMAWRDAMYIVDRLRLWSSRFGVAWQLEADGRPIGRIEDGYPDDDLAAFLDNLVGGRPSTESDLADVLARHPARIRRTHPAGMPVPVAHGPAGRSWWRFW